jgi:hypothetical protein
MPYNNLQVPSGVIGWVSQAINDKNEIKFFHLMKLMLILVS